tara:strand:+ start:254 stop:433 length:180 start_codon:yes stop_codon:yes gene_type:complete
MIIINIAEWCVELLVLAMALVLTSLAFFIAMLVISVIWNTWKRSWVKIQFETFIDKKGE